MKKGSKQLKPELIDEAFLKITAQKAIENAKSLIDDAELLKANGRLSRAYTLYQLSIEEVGKAIFSFILLIPEFNTQETIREYIAEFFSHKKKADRSKGLDVFVVEVLHQGEPEKALNFIEGTIKENSTQLDNFKNYSLYVSEINGKIWRPDEIIKTNSVDYIWMRAWTRFRAAEAMVNLGLQNIDQIRDYSKGINLTDFDHTKYIEEFWEKIKQPKNNT